MEVPKGRLCDPLLLYCCFDGLSIEIGQYTDQCPVVTSMSLQTIKGQKIKRYRKYLSIKYVECFFFTFEYMEHFFFPIKIILIFL